MAKYQKVTSFIPSTNKQQFYPLSKSVTDIPITKFNHMWTIKSFSIIPTDVEFICCPNFSPPSSKDKWFMKLRPKSVDESTGNEYIGIHLFLRSCEDKNKHQVRAKYVISVLDAEGDRRFTGECSKPEGRIFKAGTEGHGYKLLAPRDVLLSAAHNMLGPEDTLQVLCEITVFGEINSTLIPMLDTNLYTEKEFEEGSIASDFSVLSSSPEGSDTIVETKDGVQLKAHKLVLKTRSKVFEAMFEHETKEKAENRIVIPDFDTPVIKEMINFIYSDTVDDTKLSEIAGDLLLAADKYDLPKLKKICEQYLAANTIKSENSGYLLTLSDSCNCVKLKEKVMDFIINNPSKICESEEWETQVGKRPYLYKEAFQALIKKQRTN
ncbi:Kruppel-like zinc finger protein [Leptotrombidium deliense]|uniref:Kruppel-like zinc finger protein n=1 Tax=Leptotrombidium deliense TaxID=299467 RepID=A0A443SA25_9ACAR|nr:Kruppel-like zinc finger protein [Leptotrombidium deliense]